MINIKNIYIVLLFCSFGLVNSQSKSLINDASRRYDNLAYIKTSEILLDVAREGYKSSDLFQKLGDSFYFNNNMSEAVRWYRQLIEINENVVPEYYFRYAQALKGIEDYEASDKWMIKFNGFNPSDSRAKAFLEKEDYLSKIDRVSNESIEVYNLKLNSSLSDFGATKYKDQLIFASSRGEGDIYKWNGQPYLDLYAAKRLSKGNYDSITRLGDNINTKFHESSVSYAPNGEFMYFTRNNYFKKKYREDNKKFNRLQILRAEMSETGNWEKLSNIHFNSDTYSVAHPSVNIHSNKMYFASDMPGTIGLSDIYMVDINKDGTLGTPENLGLSVNTEGVESFPFINEKGDLYFSSTGYPGLGGLDIYVIKNFESEYTKNVSKKYIIENIGKPFNSSQDDFGYYESLKTREGFFTSNRKGGKGDDDIYSFVVPQGCEQLVEGVVKDIKTKQLLPRATVTLFNNKGEEIMSTIVGDDAKYSFKLDCKSEYLIRGTKASFSTKEERVITSDKFENQRIDVLLHKDKNEINIGDDLAKILDIPIIYFDLDKYNIRTDAEIELQKIIAVLKKNRTMTIDVRSHTDSRATFSYNNILSNRRNKSTIKYIIEKGGIAANRLTGRGYGESKLINYCGNGIECTEEEHQLNRRSEFIITKM